jgi:chromosome segregation ATPase
MRTSRSIHTSEYSPVNTSNSARTRSQRFRLSEAALIPVKESLQQPKLNRLRQITSRQKLEKKEVPPEVAAQVVKNYILPMFESDTRAKLDMLRSETFRHKASFSQEGATVYSELKLSEKLNNEIESLEKKLHEISQTLKDNTQEKEKVTQENKKLLQDLLDTNINLQVLLQDNIRLQRELAGFKLSIGHMRNQVSKYKSMYEECIKEQQRLGKQVSEEKALNDIRFFSILFLNLPK